MKHLWLYCIVVFTFIYCSSLGANLIDLVTVTDVATTQPIARNPEALFRYVNYVNTNNVPLPIYASPLSNGQIKVAWSDGTNIHVTTLDSQLAQIGNDLIVTGTEVRGLYAHDSGWIALLVRITEPNLVFIKYNSAGQQVFYQKIENSVNPNDSGIRSRITDFSLGDGRLAYGSVAGGANQFAAYYKVNTGQVNNSHEGDTQKWFDDSGNLISGGWNWGCSHSMEERLVYHPTQKTFGSVCLSDCYPAQGIFWNADNSQTLYLAAGNCAGQTNAGFGAIIPHKTDWYMVFTAPRVGNSYASGGTDVALLKRSSSDTFGSIVWLTNTNGISETSSHLVHYGAENFLVAWRELPAKFMIAVITPDGTFIKAPEDIYSKGIFTERDDFFNFPNGDVGWVATWSGAAKETYTTTSQVLRVVRVALGGAVCGNGFVEYNEACDEISSCCSNCEYVGDCSSPGDGPCCVNCMFAGTSVQCKTANSTSCEASAVCTGDSPTCPDPECQPRASCSTPMKFSGKCVAHCPWDPDCARANECDVGCVYDFGSGDQCISLSSYGGNGFAPEGRACNGGQGLCQSGTCISANNQCGPGAAIGEGLCCDGGILKVAGSVCRAKTSECDIADTCTGTSSLCINRKENDGVSCSRGTCQSGLCTATSSSASTVSSSTGLPLSTTSPSSASTTAISSGSTTGVPIITSSTGVTVTTTGLQTGETANQINANNSSGLDQQTIIIAASAGGVGLIVLLALIIFLVVRNKRKNSSYANQSSTSPSMVYDSGANKTVPVIPMTQIHSNLMKTAWTDDNPSISSSSTNSTANRPIMSPPGPISRPPAPLGPSFKVGMIVQAKFTGDGQFYRARINEAQGGQFLVNYVDFGGESEWLPAQSLKQ